MPNVNKKFYIEQFHTTYGTTMNGDQLRKVREDRNKTRKELGAELGCSAGAIVQWEGGTRSIPAWVEEKLMRSVELTLPLELLNDLLNLAIAENKDFEELLGEALRHYLTTHKQPAAAGASQKIKFHDPHAEGLRAAEQGSGYDAGGKT